MSSAAVARHICYFGSLNKVDGIKIAWLEQWRHLSARGWATHFVTCEHERNRHKQLVSEMARIGMDVRETLLPPVPAIVTPQMAELFAEMMVEALMGYGYNLTALRAHATIAQDPIESELLSWLASNWEVLVSGLHSCDIVVHASGDNTDRLIVEASRVAGVRSVVGELSSLSVGAFTLGSSSVYVGPSSFAAYTVKQLYNASVGEGNGALSHLLAPHNDLPIRSLPDVDAQHCSRLFDTVSADGSVSPSATECTGPFAPPLIAETVLEFDQRLTVIHLGTTLDHFTLRNPAATRSR